MNEFRGAPTEAHAFQFQVLFVSASGLMGVLLLPLFNLLVPPFQCGVSCCCRSWSSANSFVVAIEDFRLVSVSPHP